MNYLLTEIRGYLYYYVKTEGVAYLKECLGINNENVVPVTFKKDRKDYVRGGDDEGKVDNNWFKC